MANPYTQQIKDLVISRPCEFSYQEIGAQFNLTGEQVRCIARQHGLVGYFRGTKAGGNNVIMGVSDSPVRSLEEAIMREPTSDDLARLRQICEERGLPFDRWGVYWDKTRESSIAFYNKKAVEEDQARQEEFLKRLEQPAPKAQKKPVLTKNLAIPANFDVHISKLCELIHTGNQYGIDKAVSQVLAVAEEHQREFDHFQVSDVLLPLGNDIIHFDSNARTSTGGTPQDSASSVETAVEHASEMYIRLIEEYAKTRTVWLCHVHSNHDRVNGWHVSRYVAAWFRNHPRVKWSNAGMSQQHRKYFIFGDSLIMFHHGEAKEEKLMGVIEAEARLAVSQTKRTYVYQGHRHHKETNRRGMNTENIERDYSSLTVVRAGSGADNRLHVEMVRSPSPADTWHSQQLFINMPAIETFIHDQHGQKHRLTTWL